MNIDIGTKIRNLRKEKKYSIAVLAEKTGLSIGMISQIERNKDAPTITVVWKSQKNLILQ